MSVSSFSSKEFGLMETYCLCCFVFVFLCIHFIHLQGRGILNLLPYSGVYWWVSSGGPNFYADVEMNLHLKLFLDIDRLL